MKLKLYLYHQQWWFDNDGSIVAFTVKLDDETTGPRLRIFLGERDVEVPDIELLGESEIKQIMVDGLRKQKTQLQANTHVKLKEIDDKIQQLLCIEMKPEATA